MKSLETHANLKNSEAKHRTSKREREGERGWERKLLVQSCSCSSDIIMKIEYSSSNTHKILGKHTYPHRHTTATDTYRSTSLSLSLLSEMKTLRRIYLWML